MHALIGARSRKHTTAYSRTFAEVPANIARYSFVSRDNTYFDLPPLLRLLSYRCAPSRFALSAPPRKAP